MKKNLLFGFNDIGSCQNLLLKMKLTFIGLFICFLQISANSYSQTTRFSFEMKEKQVLDVLREIESNSNYRFFYQREQLDVERRVSIFSDNNTVEEILSIMFDKEGIKYKILDNDLIVLSPAEGSAGTVLQQKVTGKVTDTNGEPIPGVSIRLKDTTIGTITDINGDFFLEEIAGDGILVFSFIGMKEKEVTVAGKSIINVVLENDVVGLEEVVAVGYGMQKKTSVTAAVAAVEGEKIERSVVPNISGALAGNIAGISMRPNGGQPGYDNPDIHIRGIATTGNNAPLIVVDGIIRDNINEISPNVIESVTVLKDAAAVAPYGLGGANGVILITTKKGKKGKPEIRFNSYMGFQSPTYFPDMLNAQDYMELRNEAFLNSNPSSTALPFDEDFISNYNQLHSEDPDLYPISNALEELVNKQASISNYSIDMVGGNEEIRYYANFGVFDQKGMFDNTNYKRYSYRINLDVKATNTTNVSVSLNGSVSKTNDVEPAISTGRVFRAAYKYVPIATLYYSNGLWGEFAGNSPVGMLNAGYKRIVARTFLSTVSVNQDISFVKGLSLKGTFSWDPSASRNKGLHKPHYYYSLDSSTDAYTYNRQISTNEGWVNTYTWLSQSYEENQNFTYQGIINYNRCFGDHTLTGLVVLEGRNNKYQTFGARRNNYSLDIDELSLGSSDKDDFDNWGSSSTGSQIGYVYRLNYDYKGKYLMEFSGRYDGHYYFAPGKRWSYFPALSVGWLISDEKFMSSTKSYLDKLKLRGSWGKSGNLAGSAFQYLNGYKLYGNSYAFGTGTLVQGAYVDKEANEDITWEKSTKTNIGLEAVFLNNLFRFEADYFFEERTGMLLAPAITVPEEYGISLSQENAGIMKNHGFEFLLGVNHTFRNGFQFSVDANFSYSKNSMKQIYETEETYSNPNRRRTNRSLGTQFGYHSLGLFKTADDINGDGVINSDDGFNIEQFGTVRPGDIRYADISGPEGQPDGKIDSNDETVIGDPVYPAITYGITPSVSWKGVDLSLFFQGAAISSLYASGFQTIPFNSNNSNASYEYYNNRWTPETQNAKYPIADQSPTANNTQVSDFWIVNTGYMRLKTAIVGYTIPSNLTNRINIQKIRLYVSGQNLFTISDLGYMDPEVGYSGLETAYPTQKVITFGLNVTF